jgi:glutamyl-tRNA reductase
VITGLESKIIGETNIHGQVKKAYFEAIENDHTSVGLNKLFQTAFRISKKVRAESDITGTIISHSRACIELINTEVEDIKDKKIIVVGAHHTNKKIIRLLTSANCKKIFIANRTDSKAELIAKDFECDFLPYSKLKNKIKEVDILISAVRAKQPILFSDDFTENKNIIAIDLSVPRSINLNENAGIKYFNIEDVEKFIHCEVNRNKIKKAEQIIETLISRIYTNEFKNQPHKSHKKT